VANIPVHENYVQMLKSLLSDMETKCRVFVTTLVEELISLARANIDEENSRAKYADMLQFISSRFPALLDVGLSNSMSKLSDAKGSKRKRDGDISSLSGNDQSTLKFISDLFAGSRHAHIDATEQCSASTLAVSLEHPEITVRLAAISQLQILAEKVVNGEARDEREFVERSILRRLCDADMSAVTSVLAFKEDILRGVLCHTEQVRSSLTEVINRLHVDTGDSFSECFSSICVLLSSDCASIPVSDRILLIISALSSQLSKKKLAESTFLKTLSSLGKIEHPLLVGVNSLIREKDDAEKKVFSVVKLMGKNVSDHDIPVLSKWIDSCAKAVSNKGLKCLESSVLLIIIKILASSVDHSSSSHALLFKGWKVYWSLTNDARGALKSKPAVYEGAMIGMFLFSCLFMCNIRFIFCVS
jgi:hypothetical protein